MRNNKPKADFFEVVENVAIIGGFLAIVTSILLNLVSYV